MMYMGDNFVIYKALKHFNKAEKLELSIRLSEKASGLHTTRYFGVRKVKWNLWKAQYKRCKTIKQIRNWKKLFVGSEIRKQLD